MKDKCIKLLQFLRLADEFGRLSLTNIALYCVLVKVMYSPVTDFSNIAALLIGLISYQFRQYQNAPDAIVAAPQDTTAVDSLTADLNAMKSQLNNVVLKLGIQNILK